MARSIAGFCAEFIRILVTLTWPVSDYVLNFLYGLFMGATKQLPPIENKILLLSAIELAAKIRTKELSCEEVMKTYVERAKIVHPYINAATDERYEDALKDAKKVDEFLASGAKSELEIARDTPLLGVPFTCKEAIGVKDMRQNSGLVRYKDHIAEEDSDTAALYKKAGAIPLTVTNVPELCMWWESANHVSGLTKSPFDITRTVGGSSDILSLPQADPKKDESGQMLFSVDSELASVNGSSEEARLHGQIPALNECLMIMVNGAVVFIPDLA
ncbi:Fatty-acid amide hydrolase 2-A like protein [Argiope bruennichi]|uniref:Fatty-acid amide hydrolase 2-A like protein n=1 Tax=Argiope bruennichi TaxID=94029 RepID=A0A8T0EQT1_ARGBR|nr:Fatty-acid amide hydrolase 2-A like protein [Argiope bruennichi]